MDELGKNIVVQGGAQVAIGDEDVVGERFIGLVDWFILRHHKGHAAALHLDTTHHIVAMRVFAADLLVVDAVLAAARLEQLLGGYQTVDGLLHLFATLLVEDTDLGGDLFIVQLFTLARREGFYDFLS